MTVMELIQKLAQCPPHALVEDDEVMLIGTVWANESENRVLLTVRPDPGNAASVWRKVK